MLSLHQSCGIHETDLCKASPFVARTLGSLTLGIAATFANIFWGWFYDLKRFKRPTLAKIC